MSTNAARFDVRVDSLSAASGLLGIADGVRKLAGVWQQLARGERYWRDKEYAALVDEVMRAYVQIEIDVESVAKRLGFALKCRED
jgi:hypothetical protein